MRHGQTLFNLLGRTQGHCDSPLTELGIEQASKVKAYFEEQGIQFDYGYSSTQERAEDTLKLVYDGDYDRLKGLKEWNFGTFEGAPTYLEPKRKPGTNSHGDNFVQYGGESTDDITLRMNHSLNEIAKKHEKQNVIVVSHGGALYSFYLKWDQGDIEKPKFSNCCVLKYRFEEDTFTLEEVIELN